MITTPEQMREAAIAALYKHAKGTTVLGGQNFRSITLENAEDAIRAIPIAPQPVAVTVKPLVWDDRGYEWSWWSDEYQIRCEGGIGYLVDRQNVTICDPFDTIEAAKAAAQADYESRILSALTIHPADPLSDPRVKALVEAAKRLSAACDAMWNDCERLEKNPHRFGQEYQIKDEHVRAISEAQQCLPAALRAIGGEA